MLFHHVELHRFYDKWVSEDFSYSRVSGLGSMPCKLYGLFRVPSLQPLQLRFAAVAFALSVVTSCYPPLSRFGCWGAFATYHFYFPQLFASRIVGGHTTILLPAVFFICGCCPANKDWSLVLLRIYIASGYCSSGLEKIRSSVKLSSFWGRGETLQFYIFESMWMRRHPATLAPIATALQRWFVTRTRLLTLMATTVLIVESTAPFSLLSDTAALWFGVSLLGFHVGAAFLQQLDFISFWAAALLAFLVPVGRSPWEALVHGFADPMFAPAVAYTLGQIMCVLLRTDRYLPLSCVPMFK